MSEPESDAATVEAYTEEIEAGVTAVKDAATDGDDEALIESATDLWETLDAFQELLDTVDLADAAEAIDFTQLPDAIDIENVPDGLTDADESTVDLSHVAEAIDLRELWDAMDMTSFAGELADLEGAIDDLTGEGDTFENVVEGPRIEADPAMRQAYMEQLIAEAAEAFRSVILATHEQLRRMYHENQERFGTPGRQPDSRNPAAYSTLPPGPVPDSASTRGSTVPGRVRHSSAEYVPDHIYGRRFVHATAAEDNDEPSEHGDMTASTDDPDQSGSSDASDEPPTIEVHDADE